MNSIERLIKIFSEFPGIGPRQARRFVYFLLTRQNGAVEELVGHLSTLKDDVTRCNECGRFFEKKHARAELCNICADEHRDASLLMIVPRDIDLEAVEKSRVYSGYYFVLGGTVPILDKEPEKRIRAKELKDIVDRKAKHGLEEIVLAMNWNPEGENTADFVERLLQSVTQQYKIKVSHLGKGLSMGTELEYADPDTLKNALKNRN